MIWRALLVLVLVLALSAAATWAFGAHVLIALGLIFVKLKLLAKAVAHTPLAVYVTWAKAQAAAFLRVEVVKAWVMSSVVPLLVGKALLRRFKTWIGGYLASVKARHARLMDWYRGLGTAEKAVSAAILLSATLALSVTTLGLWLILFSVQLPLWLVALGAALGRMVWESVQKSVFKALAWMQLGWLWLAIKRLMPARWLGAKRRANLRLARAVIRRRRMTVAELAARKDSLPFRMGVLVEMLWGGPDVIEALLAGFALGFSLILAIGAQNAFVLRQGLRRAHVLPVVLVCAVSDAVLIAAGVAGFGALAEAVPGLEFWMRMLGAAFLTWYGARTLLAAWRGGQALAAGDSAQTLRAAVLTCLALTWLNPHVYLDTVVLLGAVSAQYLPWPFGIGAVTASFTFFFGLGFGARALAPVFARPRAWQGLDLVVGLTMWAIAATLIRG